MKRLLPILLLLCGGFTYAQVEIVGTIVDSTGVSLPGANAVLLRTSDSLLTAFGTTDDKGQFRMLDVPVGSYLLRTSFVGFERADQPLDLTADDQYLGLGELKMYPAGFLLSGVEVTANRIPIRMKGDTMLYDAAAFGVSENAVVEDLLRRLPGMTVDAAGNITWQGRSISEVMINGKPFFGGNTTLLTQNLDAKAVKNIQVYDQKTDNEEITGVDDGVENITINLETKEEFKAKVFGDVYAGGGTKERYQAGGKGFRISDQTQWGVLGTINNINKVGFSGDEISSFNGSSGRGAGRFYRGVEAGGLAVDNGNATGDNRSLAAGLNFGQTLGKGGQLTADYGLFDRRQTQLTNSLQSFNRANDNRLITTNERNSAESYQHSFGFELRQKTDSLGRIRLNGRLNLTGGASEDDSETNVRTDDQGEDDYTVFNNSASDQSNGNFSARYNTRLSKEKNRTFSARAGLDFRNNQQDVDLLTTGLDEGLALPGALVNGIQNQDRLTNSLGYNGSLEYSEPLTEKLNLNLQTGYSYDNDEGEYDFLFNENTTTNDLERTWTTVEPEVSLVYRTGEPRSGGNLSFGTKYLAGKLQLAGDTERDDNFNYVLPFIRYRKRLEKGFFLTQLNTNVSAPSITQLQTIARPSVTGRVSVGNENLTPSQSADFRTFLWYNDQFSAISGNINFNAGYTDNAIGNEVTFTRGQQIFRPINVSHAWNGALRGSGTIGFAAIDGEFKFGGGVNLDQGIGFVDEVQRTNRNVRINGDVSLTTELNPDSYLTGGYQISNLRNSFEGDESVTTTQTVHNFSLDFALEIAAWWRFESRFNYGIYAENEFAPQQTIPDMRVSVEIRPFKKAGHYFRVSGSDLFDQNTIVNRNVNQFVTTETTNTGLGRYFLTTFFYKL